MLGERVVRRRPLTTTAATLAVATTAARALPHGRCSHVYNLVLDRYHVLPVGGAAGEVPCAMRFHLTYDRHSSLVSPSPCV